MRDERVGRAKPRWASAFHQSTENAVESRFEPVRAIRDRELEAAIASITTALASGDDVVVLARERAALRAELELAAPRSLPRSE